MNSITNLIVRELDAKDVLVLNKALGMMNRTQGNGLFKISYLTSKIEREDALALGAFIEGELVGVGCAELITDFSYYCPFESEIETRLKHHKVGSLCTLCIREDYQGKGIGKIISKERLDWLKRQNCRFVLGIAWLSGLQNTSDRVFRKLGFELISEVKEFFKEGAIKYPFDCPGCQKRPCQCSAELYQYSF